MKSKNKVALSDKLRRKYGKVNQWKILFFLTVFQVISAIPVISSVSQKQKNFTMLGFLIFIVLEWVYIILSKIIAKKTSFELELIALFLSGIGLTVTTSIHPTQMKSQLSAIILGVVCYTILLWLVSNIELVEKLQMPLAIAAAAFFAISFLFIRFVSGAKNGTYNWIRIGGFSLQPSELVKIAFVFVGAVSLDKYSKLKSIGHLRPKEFFKGKTNFIEYFWFDFFAMFCIGISVLMHDIGTGFVFFCAYIVISVLRSGNMKITVPLLILITLLGVGFIIVYAHFRPTALGRLTAYRHIFDDDFIYGKGYQQARALIYSASGGLFGLGITNGKLRNVFAAENDLVFTTICEEFGLIIGFAVVIAFAIICFYAIVNAKSSPSMFHSVASLTAATILLIQTAINVFGVTDLIPFTGVTIPFLSQGGSSIVCSFALLAFVKSADLRSYPKIYNT